MKKPNKDKGYLTVRINYLEAAQACENMIYFIQKFKDMLDMAAIKKDMKKRERRINGERRGGIH